jgi:hypothetical protein
LGFNKGGIGIMEFKIGDTIRLKADVEIKGKVGKIASMYINKKRKQSVYFIDIGESEYFIATEREIEKSEDEPQTTGTTNSDIEELLKILRKIEKQIKELQNETKN